MIIPEYLSPSVDSVMVEKETKAKPLFLCFKLYLKIVIIFVGL